MEHQQQKVVERTTIVVSFPGGFAMKEILGEGNGNTSKMRSEWTLFCGFRLDFRVFLSYTTKSRCIDSKQP